MSEYEFTAKRVARMPDNKKCSPADLIKLVLHELESGEIKADGVVVITVYRGGEGWDVSRYRAGLPREAEIALLSTAHYQAVKDWVD